MELLATYDQCFDTLKKMSQGEIAKITSVVSRPEYKALETYYDNLVFRQYKEAIMSEDINLAKGMIRLLSVLKNYPKVLIRTYGHVSKINTEEGSGFSDELKANGEEFV